MQDLNQEIVRRVLSNVLTRLERDSSQPATNFVQASAVDGGPIILIVLGNAEPARENVAQVLNENHRQTGQKMIQPQAAHPGLERFASVEEQTKNVAPKTCFMEPDRICVNSGACEMRGY
jgi:hypothetical protein